MKFSFKKFVELVDQEADLTEEQIDEIFGAFATHDDKQKKVAAQKKAEFDERRKALQAKQKVNPKAGTKDEMDDLRADNDPRKVPSIKPKNNQTGPWSANGQGRKAETDWINQFEAEQVQVKEDVKESVSNSSLKTDLEGKTKAEVTSFLKGKGYAKFRVPGGDMKNEASYRDTQGQFPAYISVYFDYNGKFLRAKAN